LPTIFQLPEPPFIVSIVGAVGILGIDLILREADVYSMSAEPPEENRDSRENDEDESDIEEALEESFPASDPPNWTLGREEKKD
jgi:hypothetical protein